MSIADFAMGFLSPETRARRDAQEKAYFEKVLVHRAIPWDEDNTKFADELIIDGNTYKPAQLFDCPPTTLKGPNWKYTFSTVSPDQMFEYANVIIPRGTFLALGQGQRRGRVAFSTDVVIPTLRVGEANPDYRRHGGANNVWMSVTPLEVLTQRAGIRAAKGKVMLGGLGLGWLMRKILAKPSVTEMVVVEESRSLLDWYGDRICEQACQDFGKRVKVVCGDALAHMGKHGSDTRHIIDIWSSYPTEDYELRRTGWLAAIHRVKNFWGWGCPPHHLLLRAPLK